MHTQQSGLVAPTSARSIGHQLIGTIKTYLPTSPYLSVSQSLSFFASVSAAHGAVGPPQVTRNSCSEHFCLWQLGLLREAACIHTTVTRTLQQGPHAETHIAANAIDRLPTAPSPLLADVR